MLAYRPEDCKSKTKTETSCQEGLAEKHRLPTADKMVSDKDVVTLQMWINRVKLAIEERELDTVFRIMDASTGQEHYIL